jgi:hypothetical protein
MSTTKATRGKPPRYRVISVRMNGDRFELLERHRQVLTEQLSRDVSLGEAAFLALDDRAVEIERADARHELLRTPTESLVQIRRHWRAHQALSAAQWDVVAEHVQIATEEPGLHPLPRDPAVPSRASYLALVNAFDAVYRHRKAPASPNTWNYFGNLGGFFSADTLSETDAEQRDRTIVAQVARARTSLQAETWPRPGNVGRALLLAIREEGVESATLNHLLAPYWPTLWGLAARGHWIRHARPVRPSPALVADDPRLQMAPPLPMTTGSLTLSFDASGLELAVLVDLGGPRHPAYVVRQYPELVEFRAVLEGLGDRSWNGVYFRTVVATNGHETTRTLWLKRGEARVEFSMADWQSLRDLLQQAWRSPELQPWIVELDQEYGEHG